MPAVVLCPSQTIQRQWRERQALFGGVSDDVHALTYQSLCRADDPEGMLREAAERHWLAERAAATGQDVEEVEVEVGGWSGAALEAREREVRATVARLKRQAADGHVPELPPEELLSAAARARLAALRDGRCGGRRARRVPPPRLAVGRAAAAGARRARAGPRRRPHRDVADRTSARRRQALYRELLDAVDFSIPTPAVVREGHLAPYQELVQLCTPLRSEREWLDDRHARFEQMLADLDADLSVWLLARLRERRTEAGGQLSWAELARRQPRLAEAGPAVAAQRRRAAAAGRAARRAVPQRAVDRRLGRAARGLRAALPARRSGGGGGRSG